MQGLKTISSLSLIAAAGTMPFSLTLCHVATAIFGLTWIFEGTWTQKWRMAINQPLLAGFVLFFALHLIGIAWSSDTANGWFNIEKKASLFLMPILLASSLPLDNSTIKNIFKAFIIGSLLATLICLVSATHHFVTSTSTLNFTPGVTINQPSPPFWSFFSYIELASGVGGHPAYFALYLVFAILLIFHLYVNELERASSLKKMAIICLFFYFEVFVMFLSSRIMIAGLIILLLWAFVAAKSFRIFNRKLVIVSLLIPAFVLIVNPVSAYRIWQEPFATNTYSPNEEGVFTHSSGIRKSLWQLAYHTIHDGNTLTGYGTGDVKAAMEKSSIQYGQFNIIQSFDPHNQFLYTMIGLGLPGLITLSFCVLYPLRQAIQQKRRLYYSFMALFILLCLTESAMEIQWGITFFSLFIGLFAFTNAHQEKVTIPDINE